VGCDGCMDALTVAVRVLSRKKVQTRRALGEGPGAVMSHRNSWLLFYSDSYSRLARAAAAQQQCIRCMHAAQEQVTAPQQHVVE
jgi:hypothetical protein